MEHHRNEQTTYPIHTHMYTVYIGILYTPQFSCFPLFCVVVYKHKVVGHSPFLSTYSRFYWRSCMQMQCSNTSMICLVLFIFSRRIEICKNVHNHNHDDVVQVPYSRTACLVQYSFECYFFRYNSQRNPGGFVNLGTQQRQTTLSELTFLVAEEKTLSLLPSAYYNK